MGKLTEKGERACAYPDCTNEVDDDHECFGCGYFVCDEHEKHNPMGKHEPVEHWLGEEDDEGFDDED